MNFQINLKGKNNQNTQPESLEKTERRLSNNFTSLIYSCGCPFITYTGIWDFFYLSFFCYAQVVKSPNDHQGSRYPMQKQESYYQARAGAPIVTDTAAKERSPELWVTLLI